MSQFIDSQFQQLEGRFLLSASFGFKSGGRLEIKGTNKSDVVVLNVNKTDCSKLDVTVNGTTHAVSLDGVKQVQVKGKKGDDVLFFHKPKNPWVFKAILKGQQGNDTLMGCQGKDVFKWGKAKQHWHDHWKDRCKNHHHNKCKKEDPPPPPDPGIPLAEVPPVVLDGVYSIYGPSIQIDKVTTKELDGMTVYEFSMTEMNNSLHAVFGPDGTMFEGDFSIAQLPESVSSAFATDFPDATIVKAKQVFESVEGVETVVFKVEFDTSGGDHGEASYNEEGTLLGTVFQDDEDT